MPRQGAVKVTVLPPIAPAGVDLAAMGRLRDAVQNASFAHCGGRSLIAHAAHGSEHEAETEQNFAGTAP
jgi:hypothetical protein